MTDAEKREYVTSTRRFDLRRILGGLFVLYGIIVTLTGIAHHATDGQKTGGIQINLWTGISMLVLGLLFFLWDRLAPVPEEDIVGNLEREDVEKAAGEGHELA
ncbi:hypothetical protein DEI92_11515 [Curtobacterium sp. MCBD17_034]|nr:hypothetical protein DEI86_08915 [Curtobacterium sp. MCBD17_028]PZE74343.1 hypothetical protein DEI82_11595 [Curtobacterium sp. MCBD17_019]PZF58709.1 hypothetical protein DEI92_11515 [Curtobacterium sp. MCBD17_034]PZF64505.1 hypothetical protein DEI81_04750 [Curtobacterium sp. MCBD17_013]PZM34698.1 hypothetical protein DEI90_08085 [Curtobacterium sp. MCBD17_031]